MRSDGRAFPSRCARPSFSWQSSRVHAHGASRRSPSPGSHATSRRSISTKPSPAGGKYPAAVTAGQDSTAVPAAARVRRGKRRAHRMHPLRPSASARKEKTAGATVTKAKAMIPAEDDRARRPPSTASGGSRERSCATGLPPHGASTSGSHMTSCYSVRASQTRTSVVVTGSLRSSKTSSCPSRDTRIRPACMRPGWSPRGRIAGHLGSSRQDPDRTRGRHAFRSCAPRYSSCTTMRATRRTTSPLHGGRRSSTKPTFGTSSAASSAVNGAQSRTLLPPSPTRSTSKTKRGRSWRRGSSGSRSTTRVPTPFPSMRALPTTRAASRPYASQTHPRRWLRSISPGRCYLTRASTGRRRRYTAPCR